MTETIAVTAARGRLYQLVEEVNADHTVKRITSKKGDAVIMSAADWDAWQETMYLLQSPANASRLLAAIEEDRAGAPEIRPTAQQWAVLAEAAE